MTSTIDPQNVTGFLSHAEGEVLEYWGEHAPDQTPRIEIGSFCGRSTLYLASGCQRSKNQLITIDHHRGNEEMQPGELYFNPDLVDANGMPDSLPSLRNNLAEAGFEKQVLVVVGNALQLARSAQWNAGLVFIDGSHTFNSTFTDLFAWVPHLVTGGVLLMHDIYPTPEEGGQSPISATITAMEYGWLERVAQIDSLGVFIRR